MALPFRVLAAEGRARAAVIETPRGAVETPAFMPVATRGVVKGVGPGALRDLGASMILMNLYHLLERPGLPAVERAGGLHALFGWEGPILTDSGGFQVLSLSKSASISEEGVRFRSPYDGSERALTPEGAVEAQSRLGVEIAMALDDCPDPKGGDARVREAAERTLRWAGRCLRADRRSACALFGIVQGGADPALRRSQAAALAALPFDGYGIGGLSLGEPRESTWACVEALDASLPAERPRYFMGLGEPSDLVEAVARGCDLFDCVLPTRIGRNAAFFASGGRRSIRNAEFREDPRPLVEGCPCPACGRWSRAAIHHFFRVDEMLGPILLSMHNLRVVLDLLAASRKAIREGAFGTFRESFRTRLDSPA